MNTRRQQTRRFRPSVDNLGQRCLLSVAVAEVVNNSTYNITAEFRWTPSSSWTTFTEARGQGELFWTSYANNLTPQVLYNTSSSPSSQTLCTLAQGYGQWSGTGTPPASAAQVYQFQNTTTGIQLSHVASSAPTSPSSPQNTVQIIEPAAATPYSPVSGSLFGTNGPSYQDVRQGAVGDCWLLSSLAAVAARYPSDIKNMFTYQGTAVENGATVGLYKVRFFNNAGTAEYVTVDTELPSGGSYYDNPAGGILWVALAEKAYAEANAAGYVTTQSPGSDSYTALSEGEPYWALQAITGKASSYSTSTNYNNVGAAWAAGKVVVIGSDTNPASPEIVPSHAYAVINYNASSSTPYQVYNPWGPSGGTYQGHQVYGLFNANATFLAQNYSLQAFGSGAAAVPSGHGASPAHAPGSGTLNPDPIVLSGPQAAASTAFRVKLPPVVHRQSGHEPFLGTAAPGQSGIPALASRFGHSSYRPRAITNPIE
jgi:hypothetical protein